jgi:hypothetical protein
MARRRYQKGRVFLRGLKERVWVGRWREDLVLADGTVRRVERSAILGKERELKTKRLAQRQLDLTLARINAPAYRPGRVASIAEFAGKWQAEILIHRKPSTVKAAKSHLKIHILPQLGKMQLDELGRELQQAFATRLLGKVSRKTAVNILGTLSTMLTTAKDWAISPKRLSSDHWLFRNRRCVRLLDSSVGERPGKSSRRRGIPTAQCLPLRR